MSRPEPRFDIDYEEGHQAELWVTDLREALKSGRIEVKRDRECKETGRVYVEYLCKKRGVYQPSGLSVTTAELWVFVLLEGELGIIVTTETLKEMSKEAWRKRGGDITFGRALRGSHPTKGVLIPVYRFLDKLGRQKTKKREEAEERIRQTPDPRWAAEP